MENSFIEFWHKMNAKDPEMIFARLSKLYSANDRFYHNLDHIGSCLNEYVMIRTLLSKPVEVEFAIWFHDCIYDTHDDKNEEKSASYAYDVAHDDAKMDDIFCLKVHDLIIATKHTSIPDEHDVKYFLDIDLSILGADSHAYEKYRMNIRKEYRWIDENEYRVGRREVLNKFLNRDNIYLTDHFRGKYEKAARKNIENELKIN